MKTFKLQSSIDTANREIKYLAKDTDREIGYLKDQVEREFKYLSRATDRAFAALSRQAESDYAYLSRKLERVELALAGIRELVKAQGGSAGSA